MRVWGLARQVRSGARLLLSRRKLGLCSAVSRPRSLLRGRAPACRAAAAASPALVHTPSSPATDSGRASSDASWVDRVLPHKPAMFAKLARMDKPIGSWLLMWPCWWGTAMATPVGALPDPKLLALFGTGALIMRGAGCTINDLWDRDIDGKVSRTRTRPLVADDGLTVGEGLGFLGLQLGMGLGVLLGLNPTAQALSLMAMPLVVIYPLCKRFTDLPQVVLGVVFNWGVWVGWAAQQGAVDLLSGGASLYLAGVVWTVYYDTIYAHQDKVDDVAAGVRSSALRFGENSRVYLNAMAAGMTGLLALAGVQSGMSLPYYAVAVGGTAAHTAWQLKTVNLDSPKSCMASFVSNKWIGLLIFLGIVAGRAFGDASSSLGDDADAAAAQDTQRE